MISIIIPIFNTEHYLGQCLDSLLAQTVSEWEALLVDDASTDGSTAIFEFYEKRDSRFRMIHQSNNQGQSAARNRGLAEAKGEYIVFLDSDDWLDSDFLERHLAEIDGYDMVQSGYRKIQDGQIIKDKHPIHPWRFTQCWMRMYRRSIIDGITFTENMVFEDVLWTVDILLKKPRIKIIKYLGYNYRLRQNSTTTLRHEDDRRKVMRELKKRGTHPIVFYTRIKLSLYFKWKLNV